MTFTLIVKNLMQILFLKMDYSLFLRNYLFKLISSFYC